MDDLKFLSYEHTHGMAFGAVVGEEIVDLSDVGPSLRAVLATGPLDNLRAVVAKRKPTVRLDHVVLHQVVPDATRIICVGKNYRDHATEMGGEVPKTPISLSVQLNLWSVTNSLSSALQRRCNLITRASLR